MADENNTFSVDVSAETNALGSNLDYEDMGPSKTIFLPDLDLPESTVFDFMKIPDLPKSVPHEFTEQNFASLKVEEQQIIGENYTSALKTEIKDDLEDATEKINQMESQFVTMNNGIRNAFDVMQGNIKRQSQRDNFEERITVLPTDLIYDNRTQRAMQAPDWR
jgi:hypothetical protein